MNYFEVQNLTVSYGSIRALKGISLELREGERCIALIGANGAGKTTFVDACTGLIGWKGSMRLQGESLEGLTNRQLVQHGVVQAPERRFLFDYMTVEDNLLLGGYNAGKRRDITLETVFDLFPVLGERLKQQAKTLSGGEAQMVNIGRALLSNPRLLILDEPTLGLAPIVRKNLAEALLKLIETTDINVCLVEQNVKVSFDVAERVYVIREGEIVKSGPSEELKVDPEIQKAFLGVAVDDPPNGADGHKTLSPT